MPNKESNDNEKVSENKQTLVKSAGKNING